jgi:S-adenosylmethionine:tRNA ribosyltransferase-isomerase
VETDELDYELPPEAIAQTPVEPRDSARLLVDEGADRPPTDRHVRDLPELLRDGDVLVVNETRVLRARLHLRKETGGAVEVLLLERAPDGWWEALVRPSRRLPPGTEVAADDLTITIGDDLGEGRRRVALTPAVGRGVDAELAAVDALGQLPLPPYITSDLADPERYQTVFSRVTSSTAAPTAGLHLTPAVLDAVAARGVPIHRVELAIGLDTFRPITTEKVDDHPMHSERYRVPPETWDACARAERVVAVGTTVVRALESAVATGTLEGRTELFIRGDDPFRIVGAVMTNFHLPRTTLLALIDAFIGPRWRDLYAVALERGYRFLSFGDAVFLPARARGSLR